MPTYISLINWTDQGIRSFRESVDRYEAANEAGQSLGVTFKDAYWTIGPYDIVAILEGPDDEAVTAALLAIGAQGNIRTATLRAFTADEMRGVIGRVP